MVNLKIKDAEAMSAEELNNKLVELRKEMMKDNTQITTGTVPKNPGQVGMNRKIIARILTVLNKKKQPAESGEKEAKEPKQPKEVKPAKEAKKTKESKQTDANQIKKTKSDKKIN